MSYETVIGLEVHAQLLTQSKLFCGCPTTFGSEPNANTCPVCLGLPGVLPVLNRRAVEFAIRLGLATGCRIAPKNVFARKNYFYPDLPKGYQISQYEIPICTDGFIPIDEKKIGLQRIHMEEDAGKLLHEHPQTRSKAASWVDLNRSGVPLLEIVSHPEIGSPAEAVEYLKELRRILICLEICDGNMEEGSFRCDANISLKPVGEKKLGMRVEIKNMNSFRHIEKALLHEIDRQTGVLNAGGRVVQETMLWDPQAEQTQSMRSKEEAHDYRYFPDPDLLPLEVDAAWVEKVKGELPELPRAKRERFVRDYQLTATEADWLTDLPSTAQFFEECVKLYPHPKKVANWVINNIRGPIQPVFVAKTLEMVDQGALSSNLAKAVLQKVFETGRSPEEIVKAEGLTQVSDEGDLSRAVEEVIGENPKEADRYRAGEDKLLSFLLGQVMKKTGGRANPKRSGELFKQKLR